MTATNNDRRKPGCSAAAGSGCGSIFAGFSKKTSTFMRVVCFIAAAAFLFCFSGCKKNKDKNGVPNDKTAAVASIGDETVSYALYTAAFDSYLSYMEQMGYDPVSNEEELQKFRDWVLEYLVKDMVVLYRAKEEGFKLSDEQIAESDAQAETELKENMTIQNIDCVLRLKANNWCVSFLYHDEPVCLELCRDYLPKCYLKTVAEWTVEDYLEKRRFDEIYQSMS